MMTSIAQLPAPIEPRSQTLNYTGILELRNHNLVCKLADKNMGLTAMFGPVYRRGLEAELKKSFHRVSSYPHADIVRRLRNIAKLAPFGIKRTTDLWLTWAEEHDEPAPFYVIPKLHKPKLAFRPIAAAHSYALAQVSKTLSDMLNKHVRRIKGIAMNSKEVVNELESLVVPEDGAFLCFDVEAMYPSMDIADTLKTMQQCIPELSHNHRFLYKSLQLLLRNSYVSAMDMVYQQRRGIATGTQTAPALANLYLDAKMRKLLEDPDIYWSKRYIDDGILYVKTGSEDRLKKDIQDIHGLTFTFEQNPFKAIFLDLEIYKGSRFNLEGRLDLKPYFKPTNLLLFMPFNSAHPLYMKKGIVRGEAIRLLRASSDKQAWLEACNHVFKGLLARGYPARVIAATWRKLRYEQRITYLGDRVEIVPELDSEIQIRSRRQQTLTRDESGRIKLMTHAPPDRAVIPYKGYSKALRVQFHHELYKCWKSLLNKHPLMDCLTAGPGGTYTRPRREILERWPPTVMYSDFQTVTRRLVSAKQSWPGPHAVARADATRKRHHTMAQQDTTNVCQRDLAYKRPRTG